MWEKRFEKITILRCNICHLNFTTFFDSSTMDFLLTNTWKVCKLEFPVWHNGLRIRGIVPAVAWVWSLAWHSGQHTHSYRFLSSFLPPSFPPSFLICFFPFLYFLFLSFFLSFFPSFLLWWHYLTIQQSHLEIYPREMKPESWGNIYTPIFISVLFTVAKIRRQLKCLSADDKENVIFYIYMCIYVCVYVYIHTYVCVYICVCAYLYFSLKNEEVLLFATTWQILG